jgi:hypothetical protein
MERQTKRRSILNSVAGCIQRWRVLPAALLVSVLLEPAAKAQDIVKTAETKTKIAQVFFAQRHVQAPDSPYFKLVGNLETLIKVHVDGKKGSRAPNVSARLALGARTEQLPLKGPSVLPGPAEGNPVMTEQKYEDSFTAFIPKEWVKTGLKVTVELKEPAPSGGGSALDSKVYDQLKIGAPTRLIMWMFDFHFFGGAKGADYPQGWFEELGSKLPVAELELRRTRNILLDKLVMPPRADGPAVLCSSREEYQKKTGQGFDGEQDIAGQWNGALKEAAGAGWGGTRSLYYSNIYGVPSGGTGGGLSGRGNGRQVGILLHELGHSFGLPHWAGKDAYPYVGPMHGIQDEPGRPHVGPVWTFDPTRRLFLSPLHEGKFKHDPMQGGGANRSGGPYLMTPFSDYSVSRIRECLEQTQVVWDERAGQYNSWNQATGSYSNVARIPGQHFCPIEHDAEVISVLGSASLATPEANIIYPVIGPYKAGLIERFDAASPADRSKAQTRKYKATCNLSLRVTQGGKTRTYLLNEALDPKADAKDGQSFTVFAINLPARDGEIAQADLLHTPEVLSKGVAPDAKVLFSWKGPSPATYKTEYVTSLYPTAAGPVIAAKPNGAASVPAKTEGPVSTGTSALAVANASAAKTAAAAAPRVSVPEEMLREWTGKLIQLIASSAKAGKPLKGWVNVQGRAASYPLLGADEKQLQVRIDGNVMPLPWSWLKERDVLTLVKSLTREDDVESQLMLSVFLFANGQTDDGETTLSRAALLDAAAAAKVRERLKLP